MTNLGTFEGGGSSRAYGVSADGAVVVGDAVNSSNEWRAFRWTQDDGMTNLGTLGGSQSAAYGVSADGSVVVGEAEDASYDWRAFRWTQADGMVSLGTLGGSQSTAYGVSADGSVVVGEAEDASGDSRAFRWTQATGMQTVEDWLRAAGVTVPADITLRARGVNADGSVVVGKLENENAFIARVSSAGSGLVTLADLAASLASTAQGGAMALSLGNTILNGAHSRPLARRVAPGRNVFWLAGDWGRDDHGVSDGHLGLAEVGFGRNVGTAQWQVALGHDELRQDLAFNGRARAAGTYLLAEGLLPVSGALWAAFTGYVERGHADLRRGYLNAGAQDHSAGRPRADGWGLRARLQWDGIWRRGKTAFSPYADLARTETRLAAYTETGGGFPARFDARSEKATELRLGADAVRPLPNGLSLVGTLEAAHRFERAGARTTGEVIGLFPFAFDGEKRRRDWLRAGLGVEGQLAEGRAYLVFNATTKGAAPSAWLAAGWQKAF